MDTETTYAIILPILWDGAVLEAGTHLALADVAPERLASWQAHGLIVEDPPAEPTQE